MVRLTLTRLIEYTVYGIPLTVHCIPLTGRNGSVLPRFFRGFLDTLKAYMTSLKISCCAEKSISALKNFRFRSVSGKTSRQNFFSKIFYCTKRCVTKFQGESLGTFLTLEVVKAAKNAF